MSETDEMLAYLVAIHEESGREVDEETYALLSDDVLEDARARPPLSRQRRASSPKPTRS
jgi:hypothetical protein